jgi:hypothetical protein
MSRWGKMDGVADLPERAFSENKFNRTFEGGGGGGGSTPVSVAPPPPPPPPPKPSYSAGAAPTAAWSPSGGGSAGMSPFQQASMAQQGALMGTAAGMAYTPQQVRAGQLSRTSMTPYMNPYTQNVIGGLQQEAQRSAQMATNQLGAQATAAGAFGGSRQAIAQGQMMGDIQRGLNQQTGQLLQSGYGQAQAAAQQDIANRLAAQQFNVTSGLSGAQQRLGAAQQLGGLGQQSFGYGQAIQQNIAQQGQQQQVLNQALIDAAKGQYAGYQAAPASGLGIMTQALGASPHGQSTTNERQVGLFDYLTLAATAKGSDMRLKKNIKIVGKLANGLNVYTWEWKDKVKSLKGNFSMTKGVMAQEAQKVIPEAVITAPNGYLAVDYSHPELSGVA